MFKGWDFLGGRLLMKSSVLFPKQIPPEGVSIVIGKAIDDIERGEIHTTALNFIRARLKAEGNQAALVSPETCSFWLVDFDAPHDRGDAIFLSLAAGCKAWVEILVRANPAITYSVALSELEQVLQSEYRAFIAALLPQQRQLILDGRFDLVSDGFRPGQFFSVGNSGEGGFFRLSTRLIVRDWLVRKGLHAPLVLYCSGSLDADWSWAIWRMMISSFGQTVVMTDRSPSELVGNIYEMLQRVDWGTKKIPVFSFPGPSVPNLNFAMPLESFIQKNMDQIVADSPVT
ncbi:MAG: hypothetical protein Q8L95_08445 [Burkholderiales bacterium]|nr:hypothetical protein [Burkholderiales bacterium]